MDKGKRESAGAKAAYHHGDLRETLIAAGLRMLEHAGPEQISLRELAKQAGVSHNAPYRHFADREALLGAICAQGFERLNAAIDAAAASSADPRARLKALRAYVAFALDNPRHMQIMFGVYALHTRPEVAAVTQHAFERVIEIVKDGQASGVVKPGDPRVVAFALWAHLHGIASILVARRGSISGVADRELLIDQSLAVLFNGVLAL
jgi:AcrR family transcriptional regulator